jgi:hypothetical protein
MTDKKMWKETPWKYIIYVSKVTREGSPAGCETAFTDYRYLALLLAGPGKRIT